MTTIYFKLKNWENCKKAKDNWKKVNKRKMEKKITFFYIESNLFLAGCPVNGKIIGRISGQNSILYNPSYNCKIKL